MELHGPGSDSFELRVIGYKSVQEPDDVREANWLRIHTRATLDARTWQTIHVSLLTWEVQELAEWAESLAAAAPQKSELSFTAPNLWFEVQSWSEERVSFRIYFEREHRPPWVESDSGVGEVWAELECAPQELRDWAADLRRQLQKFPPRGKAVPHRHRRL